LSTKGATILFIVAPLKNAKCPQEQGMEKPFLEVY